MLENDVVRAVTVMSMEYDVELRVLKEISMEDDEKVSENQDGMSVQMTRTKLQGLWNIPKGLNVHFDQ